MNINYKKSGERIRRLRKREDITQEQLAEELQISLNSMGRIERGLQKCSIELLADISIHFSVSMEYILFGQNLYRDINRAKLRSVLKTLTEIEESL